MENGPIEVVSLPMKYGYLPYLCDSLPEGSFGENRGMILRCSAPCRIKLPGPRASGVHFPVAEKCCGASAGMAGWYTITFGIDEVL